MVVIVPLVGGDALHRCVESIGAPGAGVEIAICPTQAATAVEGVRTLPAAEDVSVPALRREAVAATESDVIAFVEDTSVVTPGWASSLRRVFDDGAVGAAGGFVRLDPTLGARGRALAYLEYGAFLGESAGPRSTRRLPGNGFAVRRLALESCRDAWRDGVREAELAPLLADKGYRVVLHPGLGVTYATEDPDLARLSTRYHHGRLYGGNRYGRGRWSARLAMLVSTPGVPFVLMLRAWRQARADGRRSVLALPWLLAYASAWAVGEGLGYLLGPGRAQSAWR